jgi:hypothetical protein
MNQNSLTNEQSSFRMIQLDEVGDKLFLKNRNAIRKWLKEKGIGIYPRGKKYFVSEIEVDYELNKPYVESLRRKSPNNWKDLFKVICKDETLYEYTLFLLEEEPIFNPLTRVKPKSRDDKKLLSQLIG